LMTRIWLPRKPWAARAGGLWLLFWAHDAAGWVRGGWRGGCAARRRLAGASKRVRGAGSSKKTVCILGMNPYDASLDPSRN
jgi:hypothetical protein